ncbi:MAG: peptidoglycan DD-metalloendopeptidase family protein [Acutalibacteraceae bacterium]
MKNKRNTWLKRAAAFVLCAALVLVTGVFPTRVQAKSLDDLKKDYNELEKEIEANQKKLENIQNQQASNAEKMKLLSSQAEAISSQLDVLNSQLSVLNADIADYDREISALDKKIADAQSKIDKIDADISATQEKISERLRATYMAGSSSWIEILLESDSISSLLLRIQLLASVTENDNKLISKLEKQIEELNAAKAELDKDKKALEEKRSLLVEKKSELDSKNKTLSSKQSAYNANYRQISALMTSLDKSSAEYQQELQRQYRKRAAFERQIDQLVSGGSQGGDNDYNDNGEMLWPVPYKNSYISAGYGYYDPEGDGTYTMHPAIDIVVRENGVNVSYGKNIIAAQSGKVLVRGYSDVGGNYITIDHGDGYRTYYGHCSKIIASAGQYVEKGEVIAYIGNTGYVTGPHVHFQVMQVKNGVVNRLNPLNFVTPPN